ncbi:MAG: hypothetical protein HQM14_03880 [SAR324 cluster bacterium]|nr:hypothetical protein [SAR324 cluster bacterium]
MLTELSLSSQDESAPRLEGEVINNTNQNWKRIEFVVNLYDNRGNRLQSAAGYYGRYFVFENFKVGEIRSIGEEIKDQPGEIIIFGFQASDIANYDIQFGSGTMVESGQNSFEARTVSPVSKAQTSSEKMIEKEKMPQETDVTSTFWTGNVNLSLGKKYLQQDDWKPVDDQNEVGIDSDLKKSSWPLSIAMGATLSEGTGSVSQSSTDVVGKTVELLIGGRKYFDYGPFVPFVSGGLVYVQAAASVGSAGKDILYQGTGAWVEGGGIWKVTRFINLGVGLKYSFAKVEGSASGGGKHANLLAGWHW